MKSTKPIIETRDVHLYYGKNEALKGISLDFHKKEITALIGPSGCGKSTYLRTLNRMNDLIPDVTVTGKISFNDQDIYSPQMDTVESCGKRSAWFSNNRTHSRFRYSTT